MLYEAYNLRINSEIELPLLNLSSSTSADVEISIDNNLAFPSEYKESNFFTKTTFDSVFYFKKNIGLFFIKKDSIKIKPDCKDFDADFSRVMLGLPFGYLLMLNSKLTFHASAVMRNDKAVIFMGKSGMGKSTIAYDLLLKNFKLITEDICAIDNREILHSFSLLKISNRGCLNDTSFFEGDKYSFLTDSLGRQGFKVKNRFLSKKNNACSLVYVLLDAKIESVEIKRASLNQSTKYILNNTFKTHPMANDLLLRENLKQVIDFSSKVKVYAVFCSKNNFDERNINIYNHLSERI